MVVNKLPESLIEETVRDRFQNMLLDFREQGSTEEQLQEMATPEKYSKYKVSYHYFIHILWNLCPYYYVVLGNISSEC